MTGFLIRRGGKETDMRVCTEERPRATQHKVATCEPWEASEETKPADTSNTDF